MMFSNNFCLMESKYAVKLSITELLKISRE